MLIKGRFVGWSGATKPSTLGWVMSAACRHTCPHQYPRQLYAACIEHGRHVGSLVLWRIVGRSAAMALPWRMCTDKIERGDEHVIPLQMPLAGCC